MADNPADVEACFRTLLLADSATAALIGVRLWALAAPQGEALPYAIYHRVSGVPDQHMEGPSGKSFARIQLDLIASTYEGAKALAHATRRALNGHNGDVTVSTGTNHVQIWLENELDGDFEPYPGAELGLFRVIQDYKLLHDQEI